MSVEEVGRPRPTIESRRLIRGRGRFVADLQMPRMLEVAMVRSPHPHAVIADVDASEALALPEQYVV